MSVEVNYCSELIIIQTFGFYRTFIFALVCAKKLTLNLFFYLVLLT